MRALRILGAGPSGLTAAIGLAKAGLEVEVFEKSSTVGSRFHGDLQGLENWSGNIDALKYLRRCGLQVNFGSSGFRELTICSGKKQVVFSLQRPAFYLVKRGTSGGTLDRGLLEQARNHGVRIHFGQTLPEREATVIATGPNPRRTFGLVGGLTFRTDLDDMAMAILDDEIAYRGYSYLLVADGYGSLCTLNIGRFDRIDLHLARTEEIFRDKVDLDIRDPHRFGGLGSFSASNVFEKGGRLYVGEAAGLQDLLWGFGIGRAMVSGHLAARSIINQQSYGQAVRRELGNRGRASIVNRFGWDVLHSSRYTLVLDVLRRAKDPLELLHSWHNYNSYQRLLFPIASLYVRAKYPSIFH